MIKMNILATDNIARAVTNLEYEFENEKRENKREI